MKKASLKAIEKELENIEKIAVSIRKRIETIAKTMSANRLVNMVNDNQITTIQNILRDLEDSSEQLRRWMCS